jgi:3-phosphoglycerate kinase
MKLRSVIEVLPNTRVVLRMDLDVPMSDGRILDNYRLVKSVPTIKILLEKGCKIAIIGHLGRPDFSKASFTEDKEKIKQEFSLRSVYLELMSLLEPNGENSIESVFVEDVGNRDLVDQALAINQIVFMENLRFWKGEENNDSDFLKNLVEVSQFYVDDAFTVAHRKHRSIMLYKNMPGFYGLSFIDETEKIGKLLDNPEKPLIVVLGGAKADKLKYLEDLQKIANKVLIGGALPKLMDKETLKRVQGDKVVMAELREDGLDLSDTDINKFIDVISSSKTVVWAGAMGKYEDSNCHKGTEEIARAIAGVDGYKIIAGGDTGASIVNLGLKDKIDFICSGGGATLEYLTKGKLPAWE